MGKQHFVFGNSKYTFHGNSSWRRNWRESNKHCNDTGSQLVSIESKKEWEFLKKKKIQSMRPKEYFIGLKKDSRSEEWRWISDNTKVNATRGEFPWAKGEPSGDGKCAVMYKNYREDYGEFNDVPCLVKKLGHICESSGFGDSTGQEGMLHKFFFFIRLAEYYYFSPSSSVRNRIACCAIFKFVIKQLLSRS